MDDIYVAPVSSNVQEPIISQSLYVEQETIDARNWKRPKKSNRQIWTKSVLKRRILEGNIILNS